jgi:hypothetical protein
VVQDAGGARAHRRRRHPVLIVHSAPSVGFG